MSLTDPLRHHWREALLAVVLTLPWLSLLVLGMVWVWQGGHTIVWSIAAASLGIVAWPLWRAVHRRAKEEARLAFGDTAEPDAAWNATERQAWERVLALADGREPLWFNEIDPITALVRDAIEVVAHHFHPDTAEPWAQFRLPEALLLAERLCRDIRHEALRHIPGVRGMRLSHVLWVQRHGTRYGVTAYRGYHLGWALWRLARVVLNPVQAVAQEARTLVMDQTHGILSHRLRAYATRLIVLETGRAAIDLYSGRLVLSADEVRSARERDLANAEPEPDVPVRILLLGQVNAGKSSLVNAMAGSARGASGPLPTTAGAVEHRLEPDGRPAVVLVDTRGLADQEDASAELQRLFARSDLILWVAAAIQPARHVDRTALDAFRSWANGQLDRRPPRLLLALTHVDQLRPASEWAPPYDVTRPRGLKARAIRAAIEAVGRALDLPADAIVPLAMPPGREAYNVDALWARIALELDEAKLVQLDRLRLGRQHLSLQELSNQVVNAGRFIVKGIAKARS
jgi:predicted GTPase